MNSLNSILDKIEQTMLLSPPGDINKDLEGQIEELSNFIKEHGEEIKEVIQRKGHLSLFLRITHLKDAKIPSIATQLNKIQKTCSSLEGEALLKKGSPSDLADWVIKNKKGFSRPEEMAPAAFFNEMGEIRKKLIAAHLMTEEIDTTLSHLMISGLGLQSESKGSDVRAAAMRLFDNNQNKAVEVLAHWINVKHFALSTAGLVLPDELRLIAPHLQYVDLSDLINVPVRQGTCRGNELEKFISSCSNAYQVVINLNSTSDKSHPIKTLKNLPPLLRVLDFSNSVVEEVDLSKNTKLEVLRCHRSGIRNLDISKNPNLKHIDVVSCALRSLDLTNHTELEVLKIGSRPVGISRIDLLKNTKLKELYCQDSIQVLDLSNNCQLETVTCNGCPITTLDISKNTNLKHLSYKKCTSMQNAVDTSKNTKLESLDFSNTQILTVDLLKNTHLKSLCLNTTLISKIDLTKNTELESLDFSKTYIKSIDVSNNIQLETLEFSFTPIERIDVSRCTELEKLICNECQKLRSLGEALPNSMRHLECQSCFLLTTIPQCPEGMTIDSFASGLGEFYSFQVNPVELEENPLAVLGRLEKMLRTNKVFPNIVYLDPKTKKPDIGIDCGGLRKQLVATLSENLFREGSRFPFRQEPFQKTVTPLFSEDAQPLKAFGHLMAISYLSNLRLGTKIDPNFFRGIFCLNANDLQKELDEIIKKKIYFARQGLPIPEVVDRSDLEGIKEEEGVLQATFICAKELRGVLRERFEVCGQKVAEFIEQVQGKPVTQEDFKGSVVCDNEKYKKWFDEFIEQFPLRVEKNNKMHTFELKHLAILLTGSYSIEGPITLNIVPGGKFLTFSTNIHTCYSTIDLPEDMNEEQFKNELKENLFLKVFNSA